MKRSLAAILAVLFAVTFAVAAKKPARAGEAKSAADLEKEKALASPYPSDLGAETIDVGGYPAPHQAGYKLMLARCAQCHQPSRPINHRFVEPEGGKDEAAQAKAIEAMKGKNPEMFKDHTVWEVDVRVWARYVNRMMNKPGCKISKEEGKKIYEFMVFDSLKRKTGANAKAWEANRKKLLQDFKKKYPARYEELEKTKGL